MTPLVDLTADLPCGCAICASEKEAAKAEEASK